MIPMLNRVYIGDAGKVMREWPDDFVSAVVTSPPYFQQKVYGNEPGQIGWEWSPASYVAALSPVLAEIKRVLRPDGSLWLNVGDTYRGKSLLGIPALVEEELRRSGWYIRNRLIWSKTNPAPHVRRDRFTDSHEYVILATKGRRYFFDRSAALEFGAYRDVWTMGVASSRHLGQPVAGRLVPYPTELPRRAILCSTEPNGIVLDPFMGSGTTALAADREGRNFLGVELSAEFAEVAARRVTWDRAARNGSEQLLLPRLCRATPPPDQEGRSGPATPPISEAA